MFELGSLPLQKFLIPEHSTMQILQFIDVDGHYASIIASDGQTHNPYLSLYFLSEVNVSDRGGSDDGYRC